MPSPVYVCNREGVIVAFNKRATDIGRRTPKLGRTDDPSADRIG